MARLRAHPCGAKPVRVRCGAQVAATARLARAAARRRASRRGDARAGTEGRGSRRRTRRCDATERGGEVGAHDGGRNYGSMLEEDGDDGEVEAVVQLRGGVDWRRVEAAASGGLVTKLRGVGGIRAEAGGRPGEGAPA